MKILKVYSNGKKVVGITEAFISPYREEVVEEHNLEHLSDAEFEHAKKNPHKLTLDKKSNIMKLTDQDSK